MHWTSLLLFVRNSSRSMSAHCRALSVFLAKRQHICTVYSSAKTFILARICNRPCLFQRRAQVSTLRWTVQPWFRSLRILRRWPSFSRRTNAQLSTESMGADPCCARSTGIVGGTTRCAHHAAEECSARSHSANRQIQTVHASAPHSSSFFPRLMLLLEAWYRCGYEEIQGFLLAKTELGIPDTHVSYRFPEDRM